MNQHLESSQREVGCLAERKSCEQRFDAASSNRGNYSASSLHTPCTYFMFVLSYPPLQGYPGYSFQTSDICTHLEKRTRNLLHSALLVHLVTKLCPALCDPMDYSPPSSSVHGIPQARIQEWVAIFISRGSFQLRDRTCVLCMASGFFTIEPSGKHFTMYQHVSIRI